MAIGEYGLFGAANGDYAEKERAVKCDLCHEPFEPDDKRVTVYDGVPGSDDVDEYTVHAPCLGNCVAMQVGLDHSLDAIGSDAPPKPEDPATERRRLHDGLALCLRVASKKLARLEEISKGSIVLQGVGFSPHRPDIGAISYKIECIHRRPWRHDPSELYCDWFHFRPNEAACAGCRVADKVTPLSKDKPEGGSPQASDK